MKRLFLLNFILFILSINVFAFDVPSIDVTEKQCIEKSKTNSEINNCIFVSEKKYIKEIDKYNNLLEKSLSQEEKKSFELSKNQWEKYKNSEIDFINKTISNNDGTMYVNISSKMKKDIYKQRAIELQEIYKFILENK